MQELEELSEDFDYQRCDNCRKEEVADTLLPYEDKLLCEKCFDRINRKIEMLNLRKIEREGFYDFED